MYNMNQYFNKKGCQSVSQSGMNFKLIKTHLERNVLIDLFLLQRGILYGMYCLSDLLQCSVFVYHFYSRDIKNQLCDFLPSCPAGFNNTAMLQFCTVKSTSV